MDNKSQHWKKALLNNNNRKLQNIFQYIGTVFSNNKWEFLLQQAMKADERGSKTSGCMQEAGMWTFTKVVLEIGSSLKSWTECETWLVLVKETPLAQAQSFSNKFTGIDQNTVRSFSMCLKASQLFSTEGALRRTLTYDDQSPSIPSYPIQYL